jgi:hypothetical protein
MIPALLFPAPFFEGSRDSISHFIEEGSLRARPFRQFLEGMSIQPFDHPVGTGYNVVKLGNRLPAMARQVGFAAVTQLA